MKTDEATIEIMNVERVLALKVHIFYSFLFSNCTQIPWDI